MALTTGTPLGSITQQEDLFVEGAPYIFFQDASATPLFNPDASGYYWGLSGTSTYPVYQLGCIQDVSLRESLTMNDIRCDTVGNKGTIMRRDYVEFVLTIVSMFPLSVLRHTMKLSAPTLATGLEKVGIGGINNNQRYMVYAPKVYDEDAGDLLIFHLHRAQFVDAWELAMKAGEPWTFQVMLRAYADTTKPDSQRFGVIVRSDKSALP